MLRQYETLYASRRKNLLTKFYYIDIIFNVDTVCRYCATVKRILYQQGVLFESADTLQTMRLLL